MESRGKEIYLFRVDKQPGDGRPDLLEEDETSEEPHEAVLCRECSAQITTKDQKIAVHGSHEHTFFNPAGIVFEVGCFRTAPGCLVAGEATDEFTWFAGHLWRFALCGQCQVHLGWFFEGPGSSFFGLILPKLAE